MFCKFCGAKNPDEINFCGNCGKGLRSTPLRYKREKRRVLMKIVIILVFLLTLGTYLSYLIFEPVSFEHSKAAESLKGKIESIKGNSSKEKTIDFYLIVTTEEIDGYLNEELFKKNDSVFRAVHTRIVNKKIEIALSADFLRIPAVFNLRLSPQEDEGEMTLFISNIRLGSLPVPHFLYPPLYRHYPWLNIEYLLKASGVKFKAIKIEKDSIFIKGTWST